MPYFTSGHALPTIAGADRPCDAPATLCALRDRLNVLLNDYDSQINRSVDAVPCAMLYRSSVDGVIFAPSPAGDFAMPFSRVYIDTDNMTNLAADARTITIRTPGRYWVNGYVKGVSAAQPNQLMSIFVQGGSFAGYMPGMSFLVSNTTFNLMGSVADSRQCSAGDQLSLLVSDTDDVNGTDIAEAFFAVYWHSDF